MIMKDEVSKMIAYHRYDFIQFQIPSMSDPPLSDIDFKNKMALVWTTLKELDVEIYILMII